MKLCRGKGRGTTSKIPTLIQNFQYFLDDHMFLYFLTAIG